jgi:hypothetical protein
LKRKRKPREIVIMCALADAPLVIPGTSFGHCCSVCGRKIMLAPTGQAFLKAHPEAKLVCNCQMGNVTAAGFTAPLEQMLEETERAVPNLRRRRN